MSPNQHGTVSTDEVPTTVIMADQKMAERTEDDPHLVTDCAPTRLPEEVLTKEENENIINNLQYKKTADNSIPTNSHAEKEEDFDDDNSSVITESSEDGDHREGTFDSGLRDSADILAVNAINCASDELHNSSSGVICVNSRLNKPASNGGKLTKPLSSAIDRVNNGYVMSEVGKPSRLREPIANGKELVLKDNDNSQVVPQQSLITATPSGQQTTAIFNDSTDITLGNKTFITGSLTIKQYIKDSGLNSSKYHFYCCATPIKLTEVS